MSHTSTVSAVKISSITALQAAIAELASTGVNIRLVTNEAPRAFYANQEGMGVAPYVVKLDSCPYDIGLYPDASGKAFEARTDFFGGHIKKVLGGTATTPERAEQAQMGKLFQMYGAHVVMEEARRKGQSVRRTTDASGKMVLEITGANL